VNLKTTFILMGALFVLLAAAFVAGTAYASTGCFPDTNGHWAETFICWLKDNGITSGYPDGTYKPGNAVTRAEMAVFLKKASDVPPSTGDMLVNAGFSRWQPYSSTYTSISYNNFAAGTEFRSSVASLFSFGIQPDIPTTLYGKSLALVGVELCYRTGSGNRISNVRVRTATHANEPSSSIVSFSDPTVRTDAACRYYLLSTPLTLTPETVVSLYLDVEWTAANTPVVLGRTTFVLRPTGIAAPNLSLPPSQIPSLQSDEIVVLQEETAPVGPEVGP
jgi:hypothetical protein